MVETQQFDDYVFSVKAKYFESTDLLVVQVPTPTTTAGIGQNGKLLFLGTQCLEAPGSEVSVVKCWVEPENGLLWVQPLRTASASSNSPGVEDLTSVARTLRVRTENYGVKNLALQKTQLMMSEFSVKFFRLREQFDVGQ